MKMKYAAMALAFGLILLTGNIYGQKQTGAIKFTSFYTDLDKGCKTIKGEPEGTDPAFDCRGVGGYRVSVSYAAAATIIGIYARDDERVGDIPMQSLDYDQSKIKIEWRLANGKPFAVIIRLYRYSSEETDRSGYFGKKIGEELRIVGLKGFEDLNSTIDAKTPDANQKARKLADEAYRQLSSKFQVPGSKSY